MDIDEFEAKNTNACNFCCDDNFVKISMEATDIAMMNLMPAGFDEMTFDDNM